MWSWLGGRETAKAFLPTAALAHAAVLYATGHALSLVGISASLVLIPLTAFVLSLLFTPTIRVISGPQSVALKMSQSVVQAISRFARIPLWRRRKLTDILVRRHHQLVSEHVNEIWSEREKDSTLDRNLRGHELRIVSLLFLGLVFLGSSLIAWGPMFSARPPPDPRRLSSGQGFSSS